MNKPCLLSHGPGSSLREHLEQVAAIAQSDVERIGCLCHDIGKATEAWQSYAREGFKASSPHDHAVVGALLAGALISNSHPSDFEAVLAVTHAVAAHHGLLKELNLGPGVLSLVFRSNQAKDFFFSVFEGEGIESTKVATAWDVLGEVASLEELDEVFLAPLYKVARDFSAPDIHRLMFVCRDYLGRLCAADHASAAYQKDRSGNFELRGNPPVNFLRRPTASYSREGKLSVLRTKLTDSVTSLRELERRYFLVEAPTGLGKTEAMLRLAEDIVADNSLEKIVYAVPQVTLADQIFLNYLQPADAQLWNHVAHLSTTSDLSRGNGKMRYQSDSERNEGSFGLFLAEAPFANSYNVTTFNQVLMALCSPDRIKCKSGRELQNAVIIMDEFHKLPLPVLSAFWDLAYYSAKHRNLFFVLGSATPFPCAPKVQDQVAVLPDSLLCEFRNSPEICNRRVFKRLPDLTVPDLLGSLEDRSDELPSSRIVVLNLLGKGTQEVRKLLNLSIDPFRRLADKGNEVILDGLVPPNLRGRYVLEIQKRLRSQEPITLFATQIIEVGVDFDFDYGLIDFASLSSMLQRAGRVGREGRDDGKPCLVEMFRLLCSSGEYSCDVLRDVIKGNDLRRLVSAFAAAIHYEEESFIEQNSFYESCAEGEVIQELRVIRALESLNRRAFSDNDLFAELLSPRFSGDKFGFQWANLQFLADLYGTEGQNSFEAYLFESRNELQSLNERIKAQADAKEADRRVLKEIETRKIQFFDPSFYDEFRAEMSEVDRLYGVPVFVSKLDNVY